MNREDLEHIIRACGDITDQYEFMIVGSQSILGPIPNPPEMFTMSAEADIYPLNAPELADRIDAAIGEGSQFQLAVPRDLWLLRAGRRLGHGNLADRMAVMSLLHAARIHGADPYAYISDVLLERLPLQPVSRIDELLPHRWVASPTQT